MDQPCAVCGEILPYRLVDILHTNDRLPDAVDRLAVIGGIGIYGAEQVRKCPACAVYFAWLHDHDSQAGLGPGYTDEVIRRIDTEEARRLIEAAIRWISAAAQPGGDSGVELRRLEDELKIISSG